MWKTPHLQGVTAKIMSLLLVCFGGMSNTGYLSALAAMEAVKRVGLRKAGIACLAGVPSWVPTVVNRVRNAKKVITVDGCPTACARKLAENAGPPVTKSIRSDPAHFEGRTRESYRSDC